MEGVTHHKIKFGNIYKERIQKFELPVHRSLDLL